MKEFHSREVSKRYDVRVLQEADVDCIYQLCKENEQYYRYCPPFVSKEDIRQDMQVCPPNVSIEDKYYLGFYEQKKLIAVMDLVLGYPSDKCAYIGFFMIDKTLQGQGVGTSIITACCSYLKEQDYTNVQLAYAKGNIQSETFWLKQAFKPTGKEHDQGACVFVSMIKELTL